MLPRLSILSLLVLTGCAASRAPSDTLTDSATPKVVSGPGPYAFECDAPAGSFSEMNIRAPSGTIHVRGKVQFVATRSNDHWAASATVSIAGTRRLPKVGLQALVGADRPADVFLAVRGLGGSQERVVFTSTPMTNQPIPFDLILGESGNLDVVAAGASASLTVGLIATTRVNVFCSTAHVLFSDITVVGD